MEVFILTNEKLAGNFKVLEGLEGRTLETRASLAGLWLQGNG
jgi:hypothetical protein